MIKIKFMGLGLGNNCQAHVIIYSDCFNVVYEGDTYNGMVMVPLSTNRAYKLIATSFGEYISVVFYVDSDKCEYKFIFDRGINNNENNITFLLTDYNYDNLPIEKGELMLWPSQ